MWPALKNIQRQAFGPLQAFYLCLIVVVRSVVEWLKRRNRDRHGFGSKPTCAILLCPQKRHFTALFPARWSWQAVLN